jgi:hypothetical protein
MPAKLLQNEHAIMHACHMQILNAVPHLKTGMAWTGIEKLMLELKAKIRRNEERLATDMATPLIPADDQVTYQPAKCKSVRNGPIFYQGATNAKRCSTVHVRRGKQLSTVATCWQTRGVAVEECWHTYLDRVQPKWKM